MFQLFSLRGFNSQIWKKNTRPMSDLAKPVGTYRWLDNPLGFPRSFGRAKTEETGGNPSSLGKNWF